jgi:lipoprotein-releasing system ATP-binding protein
MNRAFLAIFCGAALPGLTSAPADGQAANQLSGGQRQRVALARALANRPKIIVADEPTGNLDTASTEQVFGILRDIADNGQTVVVVTHDPILAARADRRIHIVDGKISETTLGGDARSEVATQAGQRNALVKNCPCAAKRREIPLTSHQSVFERSRYGFA